MKYLRIILMLLCSVTVLAQTKLERPKLVVSIVVDHMR